MSTNRPPAPTDRGEVRKTKPWALHRRSPAGAKLRRRYFKAVHGYRGSAAAALAWWEQYVSGRS